MLPVVARPQRDLYAIIGILAFCGLVVLGAGLYAWHDSARRAPQDLWIGLSAIAVLFFLPCASLLWLMRRLRIVADARGLQIYGVFKTRFISWNDIEDYELRPPGTYGQQTRLTWIRASGKWRRLPTLHDNMDELRAAIQAQATSSRARDWQLNIARDDADSWPKTYVYSDPTGAKQFALVVAGLLFIGALILSGNLGASATRANSSADAYLHWLQVAVLLLPLLLIHTAIMRAKKRAGGQTIRADQTALIIVDNDVSTRIAWDEIADYFIEDPKKGVALSQYVVEGEGTRAVFHAEIANFAELKALIVARAINAKSSEWRHRENSDIDTLGGEPSLWAGGAPGVGRKVYHYRTRTFRALLLLGSSVALACMIPLTITFTSENYANKFGDQIGVSVSMGVMSVVIALGWLAFWRSSIQTNENGVFHRSIWGERFLIWNEIEAFAFNGYFYTLTSARATIRYGLVAAEQSLRAEIEARADLKMRRTDRSESDE